MIQKVMWHGKGLSCYTVGKLRTEKVEAIHRFRFAYQEWKVMWKKIMWKVKWGTPELNKNQNPARLVIGTKVKAKGVKIKVMGFCRTNVGRLQQELCEIEWVLAGNDIE